MPPEFRVHVSATEVTEFRRLVQFVAEVSTHADAYEDADLQEIVRDLRIDLLKLLASKETDEFDA